MIPPRWETPKPRGVHGSYGPEVVAWAERELSLTLDDWQQYVITNALRYDRNGDLIARIAMWSTARQNGKSVIVRSLFGWLLDPEAGGKVEAFRGWEAVAAAAHDAKQARLIYKGVYRDLASIPRLTRSERVPHRAAIRAPIYLTLQAGIQAPHLSFDIVTSEPGSARGNSFGALAWDEILTQRDWEMFGALSPTQIAQRSPIMLLTSTAGHPDSIVLRTFYDRLVRIAAGDEKPDPTFYGAWWESSDPDAAFDWKQIRQANPSPRLPKAAIRAEYGNLPPDQWKRERLNHFVDVTAPGAFNPGVWAACRASAPLDGLSGPYALGVDIEPGWGRATITAAGIREDGRVGAEVYRDVRAEEGKPITSEMLVALCHAFPDPVRVCAYEGVIGAAPAFRRDAEETGFPWDELKPSAVVAACMDVTEMIQSRRLAVDDPLIDAQIAGAARRPVGQDGAFRFGRAASLGPIDAVMSMTFAAHAIAYKPPPVQIFI